MPLRKDLRLFIGVFRNLKLKAWGFDQVIPETFQITVFQVTCKPARWAARPQLAHGDHKWEGPSAEYVMQLVENDFELCIYPWGENPEPKAPAQTLRSAADVDGGRKRA